MMKLDTPEPTQVLPSQHRKATHASEEDEPARAATSDGARTRRESYRPRVSIGLPVYNGANYLEGALDSILAQTFGDFELIISDNASTDATPEICRAYAARDERIRYYRNEENLGGSENFNRVVRLARGEYFRWACHDDLLEPACVEACVEVLDRHPSVVLAYPQTITIDAEGVPVDKSPEELHLKSLHLRASRPHVRFREYLKTYYPVGGKCDPLFGVARTSMLRKTALIDSYPSSDKILLGELALRGELYEVPRPLFLRRDHPQTSVRANPGMEARAAWFDPANKGKKVFPYWRWFFAYLAAIRRGRLSFFEELMCYSILVRRYVRHTWRFMREEARVALQAIFNFKLMPLGNSM